MYKSSILKRFSTIFTVLFFPYITHEGTAQNLILSVRSSLVAGRSLLFALRSSLFFLLSAIAPKMQVRSRAIERFQRAMRSALQISVAMLHRLRFVENCQWQD